MLSEININDLNIIGFGNVCATKDHKTSQQHHLWLLEITTIFTIS